MCITLNSRSGRPRPMNERVHLSNVVRRLPNPVRKARWTKAHTTQPGNPLRRTPWKFTMARNRPMAAALPRSRYLKGSGRFALQPAQDRVGRVQPPCMATSATPGRLLSAIMSPTTNTSGCPGREQSGSTAMRPARSSSAPVALASSVGQGRRLDTCSPEGDVRRQPVGVPGARR